MTFKTKYELYFFSPKNVSVRPAARAVALGYVKAEPPSICAEDAWRMVQGVPLRGASGGEGAQGSVGLLPPKPLLAAPMSHTNVGLHLGGS